MAPEIAANVVYGGKVGSDPELEAKREALVQQMIEDSAPYPAAGMHYIHDVIEPSGTREYIIRALEVCQDRRTGGIGAHLLANWPTKF